MAEESLPAPAPKETERKRNHMPILVKIVEVILAVLITGLIVDPFNSHLRIINQPKRTLDDVAVVYITVCGYLLINMIFIIGYFLGDRVPRRTAIMFSAVGTILHIAAASVMVHKWRKMSGSYIDYQSNNARHSSKQYNDMLISAAVFTFVDAVVYAADVFVTMRYS